MRNFMFLKQSAPAYTPEGEQRGYNVLMAEPSSNDSTDVELAIQTLDNYSR